jgi:protein-S-isoprenylcysteine O-methyltransferase Ste14
MSEPLIVTGALAGSTLAGLLASTIVNDKFRFWPTPGKGSWQSYVFWGLFRSLNLIALAVSFIEWRHWDGLSPERLIGAGLAITCFSLYGWACCALGRKNLYCGRDGLVTGGIYSWTRNPQYATAIPAYLGLAAASNSAAAFAIASLLALCFALMAFAEERWLEAAYGAEYRRYRRTVSRFYNWRYGVALLKQEVMRAREARL